MLKQISRFAIGPPFKDPLWSQVNPPTTSRPGLPLLHPSILNLTELSIRWVQPVSTSSFLVCFWNFLPLVSPSLHQCNAAESWKQCDSRWLVEVDQPCWYDLLQFICVQLNVFILHLILEKLHPHRSSLTHLTWYIRYPNQFKYQ